MQNLDRLKCRWFDSTIKLVAEVISLDINDDYALVRYSYADEYTPDEEVKISDGILMQCTGLKDKNGKLIYEGDIIKTTFETIDGEDYEDEENYTQIDFRQGQFCYVYNPCTTEEYADHLFVDWSCDWDASCIEVIGNIYENKELLNNF
jgi:uncharacterized phage protein (TIGR01671 family)